MKMKEMTKELHVQAPGKAAEWMDEPAIIGSCPQPKAPASMVFDLDADQVEALFEFCGMDDSREKPSPLRLDVGDGHSGMGLYVSLAEYPDEGTVFLGKISTAPQSE